MLVTVKFLDRRSPGGTSGALRRVIVAVGGELDQGVESGEQPAVMVCQVTVGGQVVS